MANFWNHFSMCVTAYQYVKGELGEEYIWTERDYSSLSEFAGDFHTMLERVKSGELDQILFDPQSLIGIVVENGPKELFRCYEVWNDGETDDERTKGRNMRENTVLGKVLEYYLENQELFGIREKVAYGKRRRGLEVEGHRIIDYFEEDREREKKAKEFRRAA